MYDPDEAKAATAAAIETGLPVWGGFSAGRRADTRAVVGFRHEDVPYRRAGRWRARARRSMSRASCNSSVNDTDPALDILIERWEGPVKVYPESLVPKGVAGGRH